MRPKLVLVLALTLLAATVLAASGCGGGKKNAAATEAATTTEAAATEAAATETSTTEETTTHATATETSTTEETTTSAASGIASAKNCKDFADLGQKFSNAFGGSASGSDLKKQASLFQEFADKAPSEIRSDFKTLADYFSKIAEVAGNIKVGQTPDAATIAKLQKLSTGIDQAKLTQASQHIAAWATKNCHA